MNDGPPIQRFEPAAEQERGSGNQGPRQSAQEKREKVSEDPQEDGDADQDEPDGEAEPGDGPRCPCPATAEVDGAGSRVDDVDGWARKT